jgi:PDDEXK-like domain of unknown function (DUF3799)/SAP domain
MAQAEIRLSASSLSVEQTAAAINGLIAERAAERLHKTPAPQPAPEPALKPREPGVYFGLAAAEYHADPSLGSTDLKRLIQAPAVYWWHSWMNPDRPPSPDSPAKQKGRALHKLVLEGEQAFARSFVEEPQPSGHPGCLVSLDDLKAKCRELGEPVSGTKAELAKRIKAKDPKAMIWDDIALTFKVMAERDSLEVLKPDAMAEVRQSASTITLNPHLARAFKGGAPEVSVFWMEDGVPLKARFDYLKPKTIVDLKRFANQRERPVDLAILLAIAEYRYDVQARSYLSAYWHLWMAAQDGAVFGECPLPAAWPGQIALPEDMAFTRVFQSADAPVSKGRSLRGDAPALNRATREIAQAKRLYRECFDKFGTGRWADDEPVVEIEATALPSWMREETEVL